MPGADTAYGCGKRHARIAVVDDNEDIVTLLGDVLKRGDYAPDLFPSSREALTAATSREYDLVISDLEMPEVTGIQLLAGVKAAFPLTQFIVITGYASVRTAVEAMHKGAVSYLTKPLTSTQITAHVHSALEKRFLTLENSRLISELKGANEALATKVSELKGLNDLLKSTQSELVRAERLAAIGEVVVSINHTVNNSVAGIQAAARYLRGLGIPEGEAGEALARVESECREIESVLDRLRSLRDPAAVEYFDGVRMISLEEEGSGAKS